MIMYPGAKSIPKTKWPIYMEIIFNTSEFSVMPVEFDQSDMEGGFYLG